MKIIKRVAFHDEYGNPQEVSLSMPIIQEITEHKPQGEGDRLWYDVLYTDGMGRLIFDPKIVEYQLTANN